MGHATPTPLSTCGPRAAALGSVRVTLRLWGCTEDDIKRAEANARQDCFARSWTIVEVLPSSGTPCPRRDPIALNQNALYDAAWAAYLADRP
jgi:hypothetical protein